MAKNEKAAPAPAEAEAAPPKSKKKLVIIIASVLILGIAGGAGWYFTKGTHHAKDKDQEQEQEQGQEKDKKEAPAFTQSKFITLEPFTVNLQHEEGDRFLQVGITLKIFDPSLEEKIKTSMPEIRNKILLLLSERRASELTPVEGKKKLALGIVTEANAVLGIHRPEKKAITPAASGVAAASAPAANKEDAGQDSADDQEGVIDALFTSFIIQ
jgi:flagellar FliL protein